MAEELTAGPELDKRVAEACGWTAKIHEAFGHTLCVLCDDVVPDECNGGFWASTKLEIAFAAAEKFGLWHGVEGERDLHLHRTSRGSWAIVDVDYWSTDATRFISDEATPALAICAAILKLKERQST